MLILSCYSVLLFLSIVGFFTSLIIHISVIYIFFLPSIILINIINIGFLLLLGLRLLISQKVKKGLEVKELMKLLYNSCPNWLKIIAGIFIVYGICISTTSLIDVFHKVYTIYKSEAKNDMEAFMNKFHMGLSALWILIYIFEFTLSYCYRK